MRHALALATLPLLVFGAAAVSRPSPSPPIVPMRVQTEGVRVIRMDSATFNRRWEPVAGMPAATIREVHYLVVGEASEVAGTVPVAAKAPQPTLSRHRLRSRPAGLDICGRHNMRRVEVVRGKWKGWRCRR